MLKYYPELLRKMCEQNILYVNENGVFFITSENETVQVWTKLHKHVLIHKHALHQSIILQQAWNVWTQRKNKAEFEDWDLI